MHCLPWSSAGRFTTMLGRTCRADITHYGPLFGVAPAEMSADEAAKNLANPNTPLASLTLKSQWTHWDGSLPGADGLDSQTFLFQPSFPFPLSETDTLFVRPAFPYLVDQPVADASGKVRTESGFGDMGMDLAYGRTTKTGFITAAGVIVGLPIGEDGLSSDTWTLGRNCSSAGSRRTRLSACSRTISGMSPGPGTSA